MAAAQELGASVLRDLRSEMADMPEPRSPRAARLRIPPLDPDIKSCALELYGVVEGGQS